MVKEIEEVRPEAQVDSFRMHREALVDGEVVILQAWAVVLIAPGVANPPGRRSRAEVGLVEGRIWIAVVLMKWSGADNVGAVVELIKSAEVGGTVEYREGSAGLYRGVAGDLPAAKDLAVDGVVPAEETVAGSDGQIDHVGEDGAVADVER